MSFRNKNIELCHQISPFYVLFAAGILQVALDFSTANEFLVLGHMLFLLLHFFDQTFQLFLLSAPFFLLKKQSVNDEYEFDSNTTPLANDAYALYHLTGPVYTWLHLKDMLRVFNYYLIMVQINC